MVVFEDLRSDVEHLAVLAYCAFEYAHDVRRGETSGGFSGGVCGARDDAAQTFR